MILVATDVLYFLTNGTIGNIVEFLAEIRGFFRCLRSPRDSRVQHCFSSPVVALLFLGDDHGALYSRLIITLRHCLAPLTIMYPSMSIPRVVIRKRRTERRSSSCRLSWLGWLLGLLCLGAWNLWRFQRFYNQIYGDDDDLSWANVEAVTNETVTLTIDETRFDLAALTKLSSAFVDHYGGPDLAKGMLQRGIWAPTAHVPVFFRTMALLGTSQQPNDDMLIDLLREEFDDMTVVDWTVSHDFRVFPWITCDFVREPVDAILWNLEDFSMVQEVLRHTARWPQLQLVHVRSTPELREWFHEQAFQRILLLDEIHAVQPILSLRPPGLQERGSPPELAHLLAWFLTLYRNTAHELGGISKTPELIPSNFTCQTLHEYVKRNPDMQEVESLLPSTLRAVDPARDTVGTDQELLLPKTLQWFNTGWVLDVPKSQQQTERYWAKAYYGLPQSGWLELEVVRGDNQNTFVVCGNPGVGCRLAQDATVKIGEKVIPLDDMDGLPCAKGLWPEGVTANSMLIEVTNPEVNWRHGSCSVSHILWEKDGFDQ